jgi:N-acetyl-anhydromuramyl-L-alanine amidase AmpD
MDRKSITQDSGLKVDRTKFRVVNGQYLESRHQKKAIFLHHTAGTSVAGAVRWWDQTPDRVGTAFIVDRDGTIYEVFDPLAWAYHLGLKGDTNELEKSSIGIEIVSAGKIYKRPDGHYYFYPLYPKVEPKTRIEESEVGIMDRDWRSLKKGDFYHKYTDAQIKSVVGLIELLSKTCCIPVQKYFKDFFEYDSSVIAQAKAGIWSHSTVRKDKLDIIPQVELINELYSLFEKLAEE